MDLAKKLDQMKSRADVEAFVDENLHNPEMEGLARLAVINTLQEGVLETLNLTMPLGIEGFNLYRDVLNLFPRESTPFTPEISEKMKELLAEGSKGVAAAIMARAQGDAKELKQHDLTAN